MASATEFAHSPWPHRLAVITSAATVLLIFVGGLVTNTGSALAVPDWPTTFGYNMFLYPWSKMVGGIFYEHSHRLLGSAVGLLTVVLAVWLWARESRLWVRRLGLLAVLAVIAQGVLGGLRVVLLQHGLAMIHACVAQAFLGLMVGLAVVTAPGWQAVSPLRVRRDVHRLGTLALATAVLVYLQLGVGAVLTHTGGWLAGHLVFAGLVAVTLSLLAVRVLTGDEPPGSAQKRAAGGSPAAAGMSDSDARLRRPALLLVALLGIQLGLGLGAYLWRFAGLSTAVAEETGLAILATHRLVGTALWTTTVVLAVRIARLRVVGGPVGQPLSAQLATRYEPRATNHGSSKVLA